MNSIPEVASEIIEKSLSQQNDNNSRTIFFVGSKSVGKSSLLYLFLDKNDAPRETLVLEYSFGRKSNQHQGLEKNICHVWEYGGKLELLKKVLTSVPKQGKYTFFIMIDLSKFKTLWGTLEACLQAIIEQTENIEENPEIVIIGGKYDIFKNYDNEIKKVICTTLRSIAILYKTHLYFYSSKEQVLVRKIKEVLYNCGFKNNNVTKEKVTNYLKPLFIPKDADLWENIGISSSSLEQVKARHLSRIPSEPNVTKISDDHKIGLQRTYTEPVLDTLVNIKYDELHNIEGYDISMKEYLNNL